MNRATVSRTCAGSPTPVASAYGFPANASASRHSSVPILRNEPGRNEKLKSQMEKVGNNGNLFVIGYTKEVCTYMDAASLIITKAGGLSSTEAATKHLPMVFIDAIPGLEVHNRDFFCDNGCAVSGETAEEISSVVCALLNNDSKLNEMRNRLAGYFTHRAADEIYGYIKAECRG